MESSDAIVDTDMSAGTGSGAGAGEARSGSKRKRDQLEAEAKAAAEAAESDDSSDSGSDHDSDEDGGPGVTSIIVQFQSMEGVATGPQLEIPIDTTPAQMNQVVNQLLENSETTPYAFYIDKDEIATAISELIQEKDLSTEVVIPIAYQPLATFRVSPVTRCTDTISGHTDAVLHVSFSPDGSVLASGGGDCLVRFYDAWTSTPKFNCKGHRNHVLCTAWAPNAARFASADKVGEIRVWNPRTGKEVCKPLKGHKAWVTCLSWEPMHRNSQCERLASSSKDASVKIWNVRTAKQVMSLSGHTQSVECVKWGGENLIYTASRDRTIKVWAVLGDSAKLVRNLTGHAHRVNSLALSTDYVCRTGPYDHTGKHHSKEEALEMAKSRYDEVAKQGRERLVSCSDDFTMFLWDPTVSKKSVKRLTGHQQIVNHICFSPDGRYIASAAFDKKVKVWDGRTGRLLSTLHGHVAAVYQVCWSGDSRYLASASKDSTVKVWMASDLKKCKYTLAGHYDEVYALDWSPNGERMASGSKDRTVKIWQH